MKTEQISVGNYHYIRYSLSYFLESMKRLGIQNIELYAAGPHCYLDDFDYMRTRQLSRSIREAGLNIICLTPEQCIYPISISTSESVMRKRSINYFLKAIDMAETLEAPMVLVTPGISMLDMDRDSEVQICIDSLCLLTEYATHRGIRLVLEALATTTSFIANTPGQLKVLIDAVDMPGLKPMLDVDGAARAGLRPADYFQQFKDQIMHIHFIDGFPGGHVVPGDGVLDLNGFLGEIDAAHYSGAISLEILDRQYYLEPELAVKRSVEFLEHYINKRS